MTIHLTTRDIEPRNRLSYWIEEVSKLFFKHTFGSRIGDAFQGDMVAGTVGDLKLARCTFDPCEATRSARDRARDDVDDFFLAVRLSGRSVVGQEEHQAVQYPGALVLLDTRRPGETRYVTPTTSIFVGVPRAALEDRLGSVAALTSRPISGVQPVAGLAAGFLAMLADRAGDFDGVIGDKISDQALDLIALAFSTAFELSGPTLSSARATSLFRLKSVIEARLCEPDLKPAAVAAGAGMSVRYANALLSQENFSIERYILHRRLERCRQALGDPTQAHSRMISDVAFAWGFSDLSHFARRFRAAYGMTPSDYRRCAKEAAAASPDCEDAGLADTKPSTPK